MEAEGQEPELATLGINIEELKKSLLQIRDAMRQKRNYLFGALPDEPAERPGKICGKSPGIIGNLKDDISACNDIAREIKNITIDIGRL